MIKKSPSASSRNEPCALHSLFTGLILFLTLSISVCVHVWLSNTCCCYLKINKSAYDCDCAGRGNNTHAYTHSVLEGHHVFLNLQTQKFYCIPDNYQIIDSSLEDIIVSSLCSDTHSYRHPKRKWDWRGNKFICYSDNNYYYIPITVMMIIQSKRLLFPLPISPLPSLKWYVYNVIICCICQ